MLLVSPNFWEAAESPDESTKPKSKESFWFNGQILFQQEKQQANNTRNNDWSKCKQPRNMCCKSSKQSQCNKSMHTNRDLNASVTICSVFSYYKDQ